MQQILKHKWIIIVFSLLAGGVAFFGATTGTVLADSAPDCQYTFGSSSSTILRSNCDGGVSDATFNATTANTANALLFVHTDGDCRQNISINDKNDLSTGVLSGSLPGGSPCTTFGLTPISIDGSDTTVDTPSTTTPTTLVFSELQTVVTKHCAASAAAGQGDGCTQQYQTWSDTCTNQAIAGITDATKDKNAKFKSLYGACMAKASGGLLTAKEASGALEAKIFDKIQALASNTTGDDNTSPNCLNTGSAAGFILCPFFDGIANLSDWLFTQMVQPLLHTAPISTSPNDPSFKIWSNFRIYGDIFLVIAMLVIVFGQAIGGGLIDAYTAKKVLPRILIAGILINLSIYIVAALVDLTNIIGGSIGMVMTAPLNGAGLFQFDISGVQGAGIVGGTLVGGGIATFLSGILFVSASSGFLIHSALWIGLFIIMPVVFGLIAAFVTLVLRKAMILALVLVSPVAFALYCLPNTEQYFKKWWDLLLQTLAVYPIVVIFFSVADILSVTLMSANGIDSSGSILQTGAGATGSILAAIMAFLLQFLPLLFIPYAFRLAGGAIGKAHDFLTSASKMGQEAVKGSAQNPNSLRNRVKGNVVDDLRRGHAQQYRTLKNLGSDYKNADGTTNQDATALTRRKYKAGQALAGLSTIVGDPYAREAAANKNRAQIVNDVKDHGEDSALNARASFLNTVPLIDKDGKPLLDSSGRQRTEQVRTDLNGGIVSEADYATALRHYPSLSDMQATTQYRATKINGTEDAEGYINRFQKMATDQGLSAEETNGLWIATGFSRQTDRGELKHGKWVQENGKMTYKQDDKKFVQEQYQKKGAFDASRALSSQFIAMGKVKQRHISEMERVRKLGSGATDEDRQKANNSREELRKILEVQDAWGRSAGRDEEGRPISGMSGASAATQAAYNDLASTGTSDPYERNQLEGIQQEIRQGYTWETLNNTNRDRENARPDSPYGDG